MASRITGRIDCADHRTRPDAGPRLDRRALHVRIERLDAPAVRQPHMLAVGRGQVPHSGHAARPHRPDGGPQRSAVVNASVVAARAIPAAIPAGPGALRDRPHRAAQAVARQV